MGFHIFSDGSLLAGTWKNDIKEGSFIFRDSLGHFSLKIFKENHFLSNMEIQISAYNYPIFDESMPAIETIDREISKEVYLNLIKTYYGFLKDVYRETLTEIITNKDKGRQILALNLNDVMQIIKYYKLYDQRITP